MRRAWGLAVDGLRQQLVQTRGLYPQAGAYQLMHVGKYGCLHTFFTRVLTTVSHSSFRVFTSVNALVSPTFHSTNKYYYKVNILLSN
jgi:hypothetical protein